MQEASSLPHAQSDTPTQHAVTLEASDSPEYEGGQTYDGLLIVAVIFFVAVPWYFGIVTIGKYIWRFFS